MSSEVVTILAASPVNWDGWTQTLSLRFLCVYPRFNARVTVADGLGRKPFLRDAADLFLLPCRPVPARVCCGFWFGIVGKLQGKRAERSSRAAALGRALRSATRAFAVKSNGARRSVTERMAHVASKALC